LTKKAETIGLIFLLLLSILVTFGYSVSADVNFDNTTVIQVDNENYTFPAAGITFSEVAYNETGSWIRFNNTDFNVTSTNHINITVSYLKDNVDSANLGDKILSFTASCPDGEVWFNLSGFEMFTEYSVYRDDVKVAVCDTTDSDIIHFFNDEWSDHEFEIFKGDAGDDNLCFLVNDSDGDEDWSFFDLTDKAYDVFSFWFKIDDSDHENVSFNVTDASGRVLSVFGVSDTAVYCYNMSGLRWSNGISANSWYKLACVFDWSADSVSATLYNSDGTGLKSGSFGMSGLSGVVSGFNVSGVSMNKTFVYVDGMQARVHGVFVDELDLQGHIFDAIGGGFRGLRDTGDMIPLVVLGVVIFMVLSLVVGMGVFGGSGGKSGNGGNQAL
jgi:hypothetical protein